MLTHPAQNRPATIQLGKNEELQTSEYPPSLKKRLLARSSSSWWGVQMWQEHCLYPIFSVLGDSFPTSRCLDLPSHYIQSASSARGSTAQMDGNEPKYVTNPTENSS